MEMMDMSGSQSEISGVKHCLIARANADLRKWVIISAQQKGE